MKLDLHDIARCEACGAENVKGLVACSLFGAYSGAWCENCLREGRDSYDLMVDYIADVGQWPDDINETYQEEVRRQLKLHNKTEEEFKKDVDKIIEFLRSDMPTTYIVLDTINTEGDF
jgi:hypothetical protein